MQIINIIPPLTLHFSFINKIGKGTRANIWSIKDSSNKLYACKISKKGREEDILHEAMVMSKISKYPNFSPFLTYYGIYSDNLSLTIVMELFNGWELTNLDLRLTEQQYIYMAKQLYGQVAYLNNLGTYHGDIHPSNILYNETRIILIDIAAEPYDPHNNYTNSRNARTNITNWNKAIDTGANPNKLIWKGDIFALGKIFRKLITGAEVDWSNYMLYPENYKIKTEYSTMDIIVNASIELDITVRPSASQIVTYIDQLG